MKISLVMPYLMNPKVLFVRSGNKGQHPITQNQGDSLVDIGCEVHYFDVVGKGFLGYLRNIPRLRSQLKSLKPQVIHAHYSLCGFLATICFFRIPIVVSLMGSDVLTAKSGYRFLIKCVGWLFWKGMIVKSKEMHERLGFKQALILPNGVNRSDFYSIDKARAREILGWPLIGKVVLFASDPRRSEKNYELFKTAVDGLRAKGIDIMERHLFELTKEEMLLYYNAANLLVLTSHHEGSPNVIKEAMFCNCPFVSVNVGDVKQWIEVTKGNALVESKAEPLMSEMEKVLNQGTSPENEKACEILDAKKIAHQLKQLYIRLMVD